MTKHLIRSAAALGALTFPALPAIAQDVGGLRMSFGIEERLQVDENLNLETPSEGTTTDLSTILSFGLSSETRTQRLALNLSGALRFAREADGSNTQEFDTPRAELSYTREGANAAFGVTASYQRQRVEDIDLTDDPAIPNDLEDLTGGGDRADLEFGTTLELGINAPIGLDLRADYRKTQYYDTTDPDLFDEENTSIGAVGRLRFSPVTEGRVSVSQDHYEAEDAETTVSDTTAVAVGLRHDLSPRAVLDAELGYSRVETEEFGVTTTEQGPTAGLGLVYEMPNGTIDVNFAATNDRNGARTTLDFGRTLELPRGGLSARLGVTRLEDEDPNLIGSLEWRQDLPLGQITARVSREVVSTDDDVETETTFASVGYTQDIDSVSNFGLDLTFALSDETDANKVERTDLTARYSRALTPDWNMNAGVSYRIRKEDTLDRADSQSVFLSLSRVFELRP